MLEQVSAGVGDWVGCVGGDVVGGVAGGTAAWFFDRRVLRSIVHKFGVKTVPATAFALGVGTGGGGGLGCWAGLRVKRDLEKQ
jgi:hypothetical protein